MWELIFWLIHYIQPAENTHFVYYVVPVCIICTFVVCTGVELNNSWREYKFITSAYSPKVVVNSDINVWGNEVYLYETK